ncbi:MAG: alpha/beta fold hydrolase [Rhodospirillales bacterium]
MTTFVLVHGAWHGGWCWRKVDAALRERGYQVFTPTLTGLGESAHLASPDIILDTHIQDIVGLLEVEDLSDVVLVGHSYAGMVITGVADKAADRLKGLVYLDAFIPKSGQSMKSIAVPGRFEMLVQKAVDAGHPTMMAPPEARYWSVIEAEDADWLNRRLTAHPINTYTQAVEYSIDLKDVGSLTYIQAAVNELGQFDKFADQVKGNPAWQYHLVDCGHEIMVDKPGELIELLADAASR